MKVVKALNSKNSFIFGILLVVTLFPIFMISNAHAELSVLKNNNNSSVFENSNQTISTTVVNSTLGKNLDNQNIQVQKDILQITHLNSTGAENNKTSQSANNFTKSKELYQSPPQQILTQENVKIQALQKPAPSSPSVSLIENEGSPLNYGTDDKEYDFEEESNSEGRDKEANSNGDDDYAGRDKEANSNGDDDYAGRDKEANSNGEEYQSKEILDSGSDYTDYLLLLKKMNQDAELKNQTDPNTIDETINKPGINKETLTGGEDIEKEAEDNKEAETTIEDIEKEAEDNKEAETTIEDIEKEAEDNKEAETTIEDIEKEAEDNKEAETTIEDIEKEAEDNKEAETTIEDIEKEAEDNKEAETTIEDIEKEAEDNKEAETTIEDIEKEAEDNKEAETTIEDIEKEAEDNKEAETTNSVLNDNYQAVNPISSPSENNKIKGGPIDNENKKLLSQFTQVNTSSLNPELQIQAQKSNSTVKDNKIVANAGLDQILKDDTNIVLDASSSFSSNGNITSFSWKQLGDTEEKISPSNSMIYSFPIPEEIDENALEFELTVMNKNGQKASDTVKILLPDEESEDDDTTDLEDSKEELAQIQEVNNEDKEENEDDDNNENEVVQDEDDEDDEDDDDEDDEDDDDEDDEDDE